MSAAPSYSTCEDVEELSELQESGVIRGVAIQLVIRNLETRTKQFDEALALLSEALEGAVAARESLTEAFVLFESAVRVTESES